MEEYMNTMRLRTQLGVDLGNMQTKTLQLCYFNFGELFQALLHLKIMRTYIDGVLRYGIPPAFYMGIMETNKNRDKQIQERMLKSFSEAHL